MFSHILFTNTIRTGAHLTCICVVFTLLAKPIQGDTSQGSDLCKEVRCSAPPTSYECSVTNSDHPKIERRLGPLKDCCPVYFCMNGTDDKFLFVGLNDKYYRASAKPKPVYKTADIETCENTQCPQSPQYAARCVAVRNTVPVLKEFAKDAISCCPVYNCTNGNTNFTKFSVMEGNLPHLDELEEDAKHCEEFTCTTKPAIRGMTCTVHQNETVIIADVLGKLKDCCPVWECSYKNDSIIYDFFQIQGEDFRHKEIRTRSNNKQHQDSYPTLDAGQCKFGETCPKLKRNSCSYESSKNLVIYLNEEDKCCPIMRCWEEDKHEHYHYVKLSGNIPTLPSEISKAKGKPNQRALCPRIGCTTKSKLYKQSYCSPYVTGRPLLPRMKSFSSCCDMLKCYQSDGSYSIELSVNATSFVYYEISFFNIPAEDYDSDETFRKKASQAQLNQNRVSSKNANQEDKGWMSLLDWIPAMMGQTRKRHKSKSVAPKLN